MCCVEVTGICVIWKLLVYVVPISVNINRAWTFRNFLLSYLVVDVWPCNLLFKNKTVTFFELKKKIKNVLNTLLASNL